MTDDRQNAVGTPGNEVQEVVQSLQQSAARPGTRWVLVVDDEPSVRRMVGRSMKGLDPDLVIHQAENGEEALSRLDAVRAEVGADPVLIVTDLQMPVMDGWTFIDRLRERYEQQGRTSGLPVIVLSASSGAKGLVFGKSVLGDKCKYRPLAAIAKEDCIRPLKYDARGEQGLVAWVKFFLREPG